MIKSAHSNPHFNYRETSKEIMNNTEIKKTMEAWKKQRKLLSSKDDHTYIAEMGVFELDDLVEALEEAQTVFSYYADQIDFDMDDGDRNFATKWLKKWGLGNPQIPEYD